MKNHTIEQLISPQFFSSQDLYLAVYDSYHHDDGALFIKSFSDCLSNIFKTPPLLAENILSIARALCASFHLMLKLKNATSLSKAVGIDLMAADTLQQLAYSNILYFDDAIVSTSLQLRIVNQVASDVLTGCKFLLQGRDLDSHNHYTAILYMMLDLHYFCLQNVGEMPIIRVRNFCKSVSGFVWLNRNNSLNEERARKIQNFVCKRGKKIDLIDPLLLTLCESIYFSSKNT